MNQPTTILVIDDEKMIREAVCSYLEKKGFSVLAAETGREGLQIFQSQPVSFVILDLMLPDLSGEEVCTSLRKRSGVPIIMLTAKTMEDDVLNGLQIGADDYMTKPFSLKELHARVEAVLRRTASEPKPSASLFSWNDGDLTVDFAQRTVKKRGFSVSLTPIEWKLLSAFIKYPQKVFTRDALISIAFDVGFDGYDRVIDTHIKNLRKKIEDDPKKPLYIRTVHGIGYQFRGEDA